MLIHLDDLRDAFINVNANANANLTDDSGGGGGSCDGSITDSGPEEEKGGPNSIYPTKPESWGAKGQGGSSASVGVGAGAASGCLDGAVAVVPESGCGTTTNALAVTDTCTGTVTADSNAGCVTTDITTDITTVTTTDITTDTTPDTTADTTIDPTTDLAPPDSGTATPAYCAVCLVNPRQTVLIPCKHLCLCDTCAAAPQFQVRNMVYSTLHSFEKYACVRMLTRACAFVCLHGSLAGMFLHAYPIPLLFLSAGR